MYLYGSDYANCPVYCKTYRSHQGASTFMLACIPVLVGIMIANGQTVTASSYNLLMLGTTNSISFLSAHFLAPCMNIFLGFSVVSAISPTLRLSTLCNTISKIVKWVLGFCMSVFTGLLTIQSLLGGSVDVTTNRTLRFVVSSFVPVVGSALGEALSTVQGCIKVLKGGVGAFGVLAVVFMFLPILIECLLWQMTLTVCAGIGDVFDLKEITSILNAASKVMSMMLAILLLHYGYDDHFNRCCSHDGRCRAMSGVQSWAISVCFTVIAASILQYISPNGAMERVMKLVLGAFVLYGIMMPIISLVPQISNGFDAYIDVEQPNPSVDLTDTVNSQIHTAASSGIQNIVTVELAKKGVNCENVELIMDTNEDNSISISKVLVTVSRATMSQDVLEQQLNGVLGLQTEVTIHGG